MEKQNNTKDAPEFIPSVEWMGLEIKEERNTVDELQVIGAVQTIWIPIVLALFTILVMVMLHIRSKRKKELICKLFPSLSLVDVRTEVKDKIKIYYNDDLVENLSMTKVKIRNNGNLSIRKEDIIKPLEFNFGEKLSVIDYSPIDTEPEGITVNLESNNEKDNLIRCFFDLLNPGDEFTLQFVCLGESKELPNITARIEGVKQIEVETISTSEEKIERMRKLGNWSIYIGVAMLVLGAIGFAYSEDEFWVIFPVTYGMTLILLGFLSKAVIMKLKYKYPLLLKIFGGEFEKKTGINSKKYADTRMRRISIRRGSVPCSLIGKRVKIPSVLFTRNLSFKKKA
ncbi:MAG: hypothetical protein U9Q67_00270 [Patescibacteria group bacterium]|nr:hypothetical protein [Patescibacteria group bacterium]